MYISASVRSPLTIVLIESLKKCPHSVVPKLHRSVVKCSQNPGTLWMEGDSLDAVTFRLELLICSTRECESMRVTGRS